jgi:hypothetical protein
MNKTEIKTIVVRTLFVMIIAATILFFTRPTQATPESKPVLTEKNLSDNRQVLFVAVDSLVNLLTDIQQEQPNVFEIENDGSRLSFIAFDEKPFNAVFLDGEYLSRFDNIGNTGIEKLKSQKGFSLALIRKADTQYVRIPSEIMHSIQLQKR